MRVARSLAPATEGLGIEEIGVQCLRADPATGELRERLIRLANPTGTAFVVVEDDLPTEPLLPLDEYTQKVVQARRRGAPYPYELVKQLVAPRAGGRADVSGGSFQEHDLDDDGRLARWIGPPAGTPPGIVVGLVTTTTDRYPRAWCASPFSATRPRPSVRWPSPNVDASSPPSIWPSRSACRSSGSRCPPARASRWTAAPRTWTGSRPCCAGSSSSPRPATRSTSSSPASTSAPSPTGTPRRRCSCTPRESS